MPRLPNLPPLSRAKRIVDLAKRGDPMAIVREATAIGGADAGLGSPAPTRPMRTGSVKARVRAKRHGATIDVPSGARWEWRTHAGSDGARRYRVYVPASRQSDTAPLLLMLHGCTQDPDDFAVGTRVLEAAERLGVIVALPEQPRDANPMGCWNWFEPAHQGRKGEPGILAGIVAEVCETERVDRSRIFAAGLSAGGAMAATLAETRPDLFAAVGVHSGLPHGSARDAGSAFATMSRGAVRPARMRTDGPRLFVVHGDADTTVVPANADALLAGVAGERRTRALGAAAVTTVHDPDGGTRAESWRVQGLAHAWSGGDPRGSHAVAHGPDATAEMLRFFLAE